MIVFILDERDEVFKSIGIKLSELIGKLYEREKKKKQKREGKE